MQIFEIGPVLMLRPVLWCQHGAGGMRAEKRAGSSRSIQTPISPCKLHQNPSKRRLDGPPSTPRRTSSATPSKSFRDFATHGAVMEQSFHESFCSASTSFNWPPCIAQKIRQPFSSVFPIIQTGRNPAKNAQGPMSRGTGVFAWPSTAKRAPMWEMSAEKPAGMWFALGATVTAHSSPNQSTRNVLLLPINGRVARKLHYFDMFV